MKIFSNKKSVIILILAMIINLLLITGCNSNDTNKAEQNKIQNTKSEKSDSNEESDYNAIKQTEIKSPYAGEKGDDYKRIISIDELAQRTASTFDFLEKYPDSSHVPEIMLWKNEYLHDYLYGNFKYDTSFNWMDEKAANDLNERVFYTEFLKSYEETANKYKGTNFAKLIDEYLELVKSQGNKTTEVVRKFVDGNAKFDEEHRVIFKFPKQ